MEYLINFIHVVTNNQFSTEFVISLVLGVSFSILMGAIFIVFYYVTDPVHKRKQTIIGKNSSANVVGTFTRIVGPIADKIYLKNNTKELSKLRQKLIHAGYDNEDAPMIFYSSKLVLGLVLFIGVIFVAGQFPKFTAQQVGIAAIALGFLGLVLPDYFLSYKFKKRKRAIMNGFPDALDLMVTCTEAGLGLNQALQRVSDEIIISHKELGKELAIVNAKIRAGVDRMSALRDLADRTGLEEIRGMVTLLNQSIQFGTSIADMLRIYAEEFRDKRMQIAEEKAAQIGTKMIFPLVLCMFPAFFIVAIGPALIKVLKTFGKI
jgi:tight adherence protein C